MKSLTLLKVKLQEMKQEMNKVERIHFTPERRSCVWEPQTFKVSRA